MRRRAREEEGGGDGLPSRAPAARRWPKARSARRGLRGEKPLSVNLLRETARAQGAQEARPLDGDSIARWRGRSAAASSVTRSTPGRSKVGEFQSGESCGAGEFAQLRSRQSAVRDASPEDAGRPHKSNCGAARGAEAGRSDAAAQGGEAELHGQGRGGSAVEREGDFAFGRLKPQVRDRWPRRIVTNVIAGTGRAGRATA